MKSPIATPLRISGIFTIVVSIVLGFLVTPIVFVGVAVGVIDLVLARMFASGKLGQPSAIDPTEVDPTYNPYARED